MELIEVEHVTRRYGALVAVDDVSLRVAAGEVAGFLGPNGAGKSTLLRMISTYLRPDAGAIRVAGHDVVRASLAARGALGYLTEHNALYDGMRVRAYLEFCGRARGLRPGELRERMAWVAERCGIEAVLGKRIQACSKGYRQRVGVAAAILHDPPVIVLDEPTHGLDPLQVVAFRDFVRSLAPGRAILLSSHIVSEVERMCDRLIVIHRGRLLADAPLAELQGRARDAGRSLEDEVLARVQAQEARA